MKILIIALIFISTSLSAARINHESHYQDIWCEGKGVTEFILPDKARVDCLTETYAVEVDFANKWAEGLGQARYYSYMTGKRAGVLLIMENPSKDWVYLKRLYDASKGLDVKIWVILPKKK